MEEEAACSNEQIANKRHKKYPIVVVRETVVNALESKRHEQQICQCIDNLGRVNGRIVVLVGQQVREDYSWS